MRRSGDRTIAHDRVIGSLGDSVGNLTTKVRCDHPISRFSNRLQRFLSIVLAAVREIFDESAYERFLSRTHASRSVASYRDFLRERETAMAKRPRCC